MTDTPNPHGAEASPLGRSTAYRNTYAPELLFPVDRAPKRAEIGVVEALPFHGEDLWNAYELSWLNARGKPVVAMGEFRVPAVSPRLIESKSLKLYLNSFNASRFDDMAEVEAVIARDLSAAAGAPVSVQLQSLHVAARQVCSLPGTLIDDLDVDIADYHPAPTLLGVAADAAPVSETLVSHLLKSNCLVTGQPDWATVYVNYTGAPIDRAGLLRYIVSFREHNEFHEQCVERMFCDLMARCAPSRLEVWARYTRRGGLDINPWRSSVAGVPPLNLGDPRQ
ncbi:MAG TPA: NADPH-dependent 7-cyano-7-deazaguanine reductase QueF [Denitromonas sp.]|uniref:NADPH-dependent 7-cyano-7-deazaguanine reductase QueF n=1 Tax=Denitromonas sp. TaxID=2734609 RepID=UPI001D2DB1E3|nr:NADPH-dependent 7-cyano-7-deazaguanine reductase QueF [Rhodocyclaceae bacterium]MCP5222397.1 NADPH-dependent 7-cyano-7-deazaguanine reductase QueF [Zoogloeaceae bacterium]HPR05306.1 NADPH-dependent 7-cyano-7-deazaguanine reductase QueF [Denitromonas sp.]HQV14961.1 NADPH-dependent 7-cyano-7-deazaguanine reductase QueF [Denitromonas sp.]